MVIIFEGLAALLVVVVLGFIFIFARMSQKPKAKKIKQKKLKKVKLLAGDELNGK